MSAESSLLGAAGEHFVMSELLRRGLIAALAPQGVPNADIVVTDLAGDKLCTIQVKARRDIGSDGGWHMKPKHETLIGERLFYCFVDFGKSPNSTPTVFVLPSSKVASVLSQSHKSWLSTLGMRGQKRNDSTLRRLLPDFRSSYLATPNPFPMGWLDSYKNAWHLLGLRPSDADKL
jgi:hypothetical protein